MIDKYDKKGYCMCTSSSSNKDIEKYGLIQGHAYTLIDAYDFSKITNDERYKNLKLVKLRNPWGQGEWTGKWSDKDKLWSEDLIKLTDKEDRDDGIFFMEWDDLIKYYNKITVCEILPHDYEYRSYKINSCRSIIKIKILKHQHFVIILNQASKRQVRYQIPKYQTFYVKLILADLNFNVIDSTGGYDECIRIN